MTNKEYIVFMGKTPEQQVKCYHVLKLAYGDAFEKYSDLYGVIASETHPYLYVSRKTFRINRCESDKVSGIVDDMYKTLPAFTKELNPVINSLPRQVTVGEYIGEATKDILYVGCQKIPFKDVKSAYETMLNCKI